MFRALIWILSAMAAIAAPEETCTCIADCGLPSQPCCTCELRPEDDKCVVFNQSTIADWCLEGASCAAGVCETPGVVDASAFGCGDVSEPCCDVSWCSEGLTCASGSCIDVNDAVIDQAPCCVEGAPCFGADKDCDEGLICVIDVCRAPA